MSCYVEKILQVYIEQLEHETVSLNVRYTIQKDLELQKHSGRFSNALI